MAKKLSLGRGLDTIFSDNTIEESGGVKTVRLSSVEPNPEQPRKQFAEDALSELADSIRENGVLQPLLVRERRPGSYEIIAGERRWRASRLVGLEEVPVIIMDVDDLRAAQIALIENLQREDLDPFEESAAYRALMDGFHLTQEEVARRVGKSRPAVANALRLLDLPEETVKLIAAGALSAGHGRALLSLKDAALLNQMAREAAEKGWSVRETEAAVKKAARPVKVKPQGEEEKVDYTADLERRATALSGRIIRIGRGGKKTVTVEYQDNEDLEALLVALCGEGIRE